jgi:MFS family permease
VTGQESLPSPETRQKSIHGYFVVGAAFIIMMVAFGLYIVYGVFFNSFLEEFGWSRAVTSGAYSLSSLFSGLLAIVMGGLTDKFGPRLVVTFCGALLGVGYFLMSQVDAVWQLYLFFGVIIGTGMSGLWVPLLSAVARWFTGRRSLMTGIVISGLTIGQMICPPVISRLIAAYEWRQSYVILGIAVFIIVVLAGQLLKNPPRSMGKMADNADGKENVKSTDVSRDFSLRQAARTAQFWLVVVVFFCFGFIAYGLTVHLVPHITKLGISDINAANVLAVSGGIGIVGNFLLGGFIGDRIGNRKAFIIGCFLAVVALVWLVPMKELWMLYLFAVVFGLGLGSMGTSESPLVARLFGLTSHGLIYGVTGLGFTFGGAVGPVIIGYICDVTGSYQTAFIVCAILSALGLVLMLALKPTKQLGNLL